MLVYTTIYTTVADKSCLQGTRNTRPCLTGHPIYKKLSIKKNFSYRKDTVLVCWKDNKAVYVASNKNPADMSGVCARYNRIEKRYNNVTIPEMIQLYNRYMGGVDLLDSMVAVYRIPFRKRKWWFSFWPWSLSVCAVNAWRLKMKVSREKEPYLMFLRELVIEMLICHGTPPCAPRQISTSNSSLRYDCNSHWIVHNGQGKRRNCKKCTEDNKQDAKSHYSCEKCNVGLHINCFKEKDSFCRFFYLLFFYSSAIFSNPYYFFKSIHSTYLFSNGLNNFG